ncbi:MAG: hypothetical protein ACRECO_21595 [Xanthobacteraceae bacterium]
MTPRRAPALTLPRIPPRVAFTPNNRSIAAALWSHRAASNIGASIKATLRQKGASMLNRTTTTLSIVVLAAGIAVASSAQAHSSCTPAHLLSVLRQVEAQCGRAKVVSGHRPGARIRGTRRVSQHSFCNGKNGAIDAVFANRACAVSALRKTNYTILTYRRSAHIHIGTDGWGHGRTRVAQQPAARSRSARRASARSAYAQHRTSRSAYRKRANGRVASRQRGRAAQSRGQAWASTAPMWREPGYE